MSRKAVIIRYAIVILVFLAFAAGLVIFFNSREPVTYEPPMKPVEVASPELHTISSYAENTSYVMAEAMIPVVPFVQGTIESYSIRPGDAVSEGDVIAVIDKRPYELQLAQAKAQATALDSALSRMEPLYQAGAVTQQDYEMTKAQKDAADAQLELAELQLSYAEVTAPKGGTVVLYLDQESAAQTVTVPDLTGLTLTQVNGQIAQAGLNLSVSGAAVTTGSAVSDTQDIEAGTEVPAGTVITVNFVDLEAVH